MRPRHEISPREAQIDAREAERARDPRLHEGVADGALAKLGEPCILNEVHRIASERTTIILEPVLIDDDGKTSAGTCDILVCMEALHAVRRWSEDERLSANFGILERSIDVERAT